MLPVGWVKLQRYAVIVQDLFFDRGEFRFRYVLHRHCLQFIPCKEWLMTLSEVEKEMVGVILAEMECFGDPHLTVVGVRVAEVEELGGKGVR